MFFIKNQVSVLENGVAKIKDKNKLKPFDAPVYSYWSALYMSFYSKRLYIDVGKRWRGIGLLYLLLAIAIGAIPYSLKMSGEFNSEFHNQLIAPILSLPTIYIQNGALNFDKPMPYLIKNDKGLVSVIIDSTGTISEFTKEYPYLTLLINKNTMSIKIPSPSIMAVGTDQTIRGPVIVQPFDKGMNMMFDGKSIINSSSIYGLKYAAQLMIYPVVVAIFYSLLVVFFLVLAFLGQVFSRIFFSFKLKFSQSCRLFMVSSTPMLLVMMIFITLNAIFYGFGFILLALIGVYFSFAVRSLRSDSKKMVS
ncbi:DUF1189 family protein [Legionella bononiensis]|uniref:DUF1189 family protein n=1 Tax=Legionella bononiensis TaxID=2793102 RepID=A0ABS1WCW4_9GAMM|nr:DUF1189 family protein [Legionella bononiensis]MBL7478968.1 DUF1189 family protein [Legionella bononiensis]MBL7527100.1 DUF1189 family protein [Legionella bononiensis]MBL7562069.1 DUF1189 family protein [Legionella bononiensis]